MRSERYDRVMRAIRREVPDRVPWALWGHFPAAPFLRYYSWEKANRDGCELARSHVALLHALEYKMDLLKVTPFYRFMAYHWGSRFRFTNNDEVVETLEVVVQATEDWGKLWVLDPRKELREHLRAVAILHREIGRTLPFLYTVPSPLVQALHGVSTPSRVYADMQAQPDALKAGLETIAQTCIEFGKACIAEGAAGIFFGIGGGGDLWSRLSRRQLDEYALHYDRMVLQALAHAPIKLLHICSSDSEDPQRNGGLMEAGWFKQYPVDAINWRSASFTSPPTAKQIYGDRFCIVAGLDHKTVLRHGSPADVEAQVKAALATTAAGGGFILAPSCTLYQDTPLANYNAVAKAVHQYGHYPS